MEKVKPIYRNKYIFAPHLDDEIIGCYSVLHEITAVIYFTNDYRVKSLIENDKCMYFIKNGKYIYFKNFDFSKITIDDLIYLPCKFDYHPLHKKVRNTYINLKCHKKFYTVDMNVPWLKEELNPKDKLELLKKLYPNEDIFIKNDKYWLFYGITDCDVIKFYKYKFYDHTFKINKKLSTAEISFIDRHIKQNNDIYKLYEFLQYNFKEYMLTIENDEVSIG